MIGNIKAFITECKFVFLRADTISAFCIDQHLGQKGHVFSLTCSLFVLVLKMNREE